MPARITGLIPPDNFELIRDQIGGVLLLELGNQAQYDDSFIFPTKVWVERFVPYNTITETPYVNVRFQKGDQDERSREQTQSKYLHTFFIEVSVSAKSTTSLGGDQQATLYMHQLLRMIRFILANPAYRRLGLSLPIGRCYVNSIEVFDPMEMEDATNKIDGRVEYCVEVSEGSPSFDTGATLNEITTTVKLNNTELGHFWDYIIE